MKNLRSFTGELISDSGGMHFVIHLEAGVHIDLEGGRKRTLLCFLQARLNMLSHILVVVLTSKLFIEFLGLIDSNAIRVGFRCGILCGSSASLSFSCSLHFLVLFKISSALVLELDQQFVFLGRSQSHFDFY